MIMGSFVSDVVMIITADTQEERAKLLANYGNSKGWEE